MYLKRRLIKLLLSASSSFVLLLAKLKHICSSNSYVIYFLLLFISVFSITQVDGKNGWKMSNMIDVEIMEERGE